MAEIYHVGKVVYLFFLPPIRRRPVALRKRVSKERSPIFLLFRGGNNNSPIVTTVTKAASIAFVNAGDNWLEQRQASIEGSQASLCAPLFVDRNHHFLSEICSVASTMRRMIDSDF